ncbi:hypothetical protein T265_13962 [Opisthorchis viverrini]|uniref:Uncharacterized protein n=1 Tax=Opisthorchis viverrini TaxID=6198 RepID=A0A074ZHF8_OPIVI|nr:hypothetical protein T265_13962 [Opisthorchis viverrini]KER26663.1 hypothetical protein T265_13962 [Opisthorchis viverrini]
MNFVLWFFLFDLTIAQHFTPRWGPRLPRMRRPLPGSHPWPRFYRRTFWFRHSKPPIPPGHFAYHPMPRFPVRHLAHHHAPQPVYNPPPPELAFHFKPQIGFQSNIHQFQNGEQAWQSNPVGEETSLYKNTPDGSLAKGYVDPLNTKKTGESEIQLKKDEYHVTKKENEASKVAEKEDLVVPPKKTESLEIGPYDKWLQMYKRRNLLNDKYSEESEDVNYGIPQLNTYPRDEKEEPSLWRKKQDSTELDDNYSGSEFDAVEQETYENTVPKKFRSKVRVGGDNMDEDMYKSNTKERIADVYKPELHNGLSLKKMHMNSFPMDALASKELDEIRRHIKAFEDRDERYSKKVHKLGTTWMDSDDYKLNKLLGHNIQTNLYNDEERTTLRRHKSPFAGNKARELARLRSQERLLKKSKPRGMRKVKDMRDTFEYLNSEYLAPKGDRKRKALMRQLSKHVRGRSRSTVYVGDHKSPTKPSEKFPSKISNEGKNNRHGRPAKNVRSAFAEYGRYKPVEVIEEEEYVEDHAVDIGPAIPLNSYNNYYY